MPLPNLRIDPNKVQQTLINQATELAYVTNAPSKNRYDSHMQSEVCIASPQPEMSQPAKVQVQAIA